MNYTLKQLADRVNSMIEEQGEDAECAAWIYTKNDCHLKDEDGNIFRAGFGIFQRPRL